MKVAFVHDWFKANGGAEKVAGAILRLYEPKHQLTIFTLFNKFNVADANEILGTNTIVTSPLQNLPRIASIYRVLLPFMPALMERFRLKGYDLILSTSHAVAKGIGADPNTLHICYCHTPMRYVWDMYDDYMEQHGIAKLFFFRWMLQFIKEWDLKTSQNVHYYIANSCHIQARILKSYGRTSKVIYPPVRTDKFELYEGKRKDYYLCLGRFVPYKKIDLIVEAFTLMPEKKLILIGEGYGSKKFKQLLSKFPNITWLGYKSDPEMIGYIQQAKACIFAAKEDFGISCVEVQACGTPVIALNYGGYKETVKAGVSGYFFEQQSTHDIVSAVQQLESAPPVSGCSNQGKCPPIF